MSNNNILEPIPANLNDYLKKYQETILNSTTPSAPGGTTNVTFQMDGYGNISAYATTSASGAMLLISDQVLVSPAATVTFSSIPGTFKHLRLYFNAASSASSADDSFYMQVNADTGNHYTTNVVIGSNTSVTGAGASAAASFLQFMAGATAPVGSSGSGVIDLIDYTNTVFNKRATSNGSTQTSTSIGIGGSAVVTGDWQWASTVAITSIVLGSTTSSNFITGSRFTLYGIN